MDNFHNMRIMVVDDEEFVGRHLMMTLFSIGLKDVTFIDSGEKAINAVKANGYDLVLTDKEMQPVNGFDLISALRDDANLSKTRILMVSADDTDATRDEVKARGGNGFVPKPYTPDSIQEAILAVFPDL